MCNLLTKRYLKRLEDSKDRDIDLDLRDDITDIFLDLKDDGYDIKYYWIPEFLKIFSKKYSVLEYA